MAQTEERVIHLGGRLQELQSDQEMHEVLVGLSYHESSLGIGGELGELKKRVNRDSVLPGRSPAQSKDLVDGAIESLMSYQSLVIKERLERVAWAALVCLGIIVFSFGGGYLLGLNPLLESYGYYLTIGGVIVAFLLMAKAFFGRSY